MTDTILVLNAGSSSIKFSLVAEGGAEPAVVAHGQIEGIDTSAHFIYCYRIRREIGSLAAALGGLDAIVFTGGIGENAVVIRERVCRDAAWFGVALDQDANAAGGPRISMPGARISAWAIPTDEELMIARHTRRLLS